MFCQAFQPPRLRPKGGSKTLPAAARSLCVFRRLKWLPGLSFAAISRCLSSSFRCVFHAVFRCQCAAVRCSAAALAPPFTAFHHLPKTLTPARTGDAEAHESAREGCARECLLAHSVNAFSRTRAPEEVDGALGFGLCRRSVARLDLPADNRLARRSAGPLGPSGAVIETLAC